MTVARSQPYVPLEESLEMEREPGTWHEWGDGIVYAMSGGSPHHSRLGPRLIPRLSVRFGEECTVVGSNADIWVDGARFHGQVDEIYG